MKEDFCLHISPLLIISEFRPRVMHGQNMVKKPSYRKNEIKQYFKVISLQNEEKLKGGIIKKRKKQGLQLEGSSQQSQRPVVHRPSDICLMYAG